ncbi:MAG: vWA domain-containing protein [Nitrospirota bacterium]
MDLFYPPILKVELADIEASEIDFSSRSYRIILGRDLIKTLSQEALLGIIHHELNHWVKHPYDVRTIILEDHYLGGMPNSDVIRNFFDDAVANLDLVVNKGLMEVSKAYAEIPAITKVDRLLRAFYREVTGLDFGSRRGTEFQDRLKELTRMDFLDTTRRRIRSNIRRFAEIVGDLVEAEIVPFSLFSLKNFSPDEIKSAMRNIAEELDPKEYREVAEKVLNRVTELGISPGKASLIRDLERPDIHWYKTRSNRYAICIKAFSKKDSLYPLELKDFELDDNMDIFSPVESYGKVLPGLAKKYQLEEFEGHGKLSIPDVVIIMDSSGSMRHPDLDISYAVLGAFSIARNYFEHDSRVGVINFSDTNLEVEPTWDKARSYEMLKVYQGGGTMLDLDRLRRYLNKLGNRVEEMDLILITDAGIDNINGVVDCLSKLKARATIIWIRGDAKGHQGFEKGYRLLKEGLPLSVTFVEIEDEKEIPSIAVGKSFRVHGRH